MATAQEVIALARDDTAAVADQLRRHPYIAGVEQGQLPREQLITFAGEQFHIISSDLRSVAMLVSRFQRPEITEFFLETLAGERAALEALVALGRALGQSAEQLRAHEPLAGAHAYTCYMAWLGMYGTPGQVAAAYLVNFPAWGENCGRLSAALMQHYRMTVADVLFFDQFAAPATRFERAATAVIQASLDDGDDPTLIRRAVRLLQAYELMYWDTLYQESLRA
jgi:pyrroloquinoline quinone (PQQ) biosynthesis protein C